LTNRQYFLERTTNWTDWTLFPRMAVGNGNPATWPLPWGGPREFYRAWQLPPPAKDWVTATAQTAQVQFQLFRSPTLGRPVSFHVMLPPSYAAQPNRRYPVLYWLHGSGPGAGVEGIPPLANFFSNAMVTARMPQALVVFPNGLSYSMWCNNKDGTIPMETMVIDELIPHVDRTFRTIASRTGRIVEGFSMGGHGAGRYGFKFSHVFRAASLMGAGPLQLDFLENDPDLNPIELRQQLFAEIYGNDMDYYLAQHPWTWADARTGQLPANHRIRFVVGTDDTMLANNRELRDHLIALGIPHDYLEVPGVAHSPLLTLSGAGTNNWAFYQVVLSGTE
jgi:enterochelin esterase-like enzyme